MDVTGWPTIEAVLDPAASPVSKLPGRRLRLVPSEESQGDRPPKKQVKSEAEHADGDAGAKRQLKLHVSNESNPEAPPKKFAKTRQKIGVDDVARPLRRRATSTPPLGRGIQTELQQLESKISKCVDNEDYESAALLQKKKAALLQMELATVSLEEE